MKNTAKLAVTVLFITFLYVIGSGHFAPSALATGPAATMQSVGSNTAAGPSQIGPSSSNYEPQVLFDDFEYSNQEELSKHGWIIRSVQGWPGVPGATWRKEDVSFPEDPDQRGNHLLRMTASTDGTSANTHQTQVCHQRKFLDGTYAARVRFSNSPVSGPAGDQLVESFYTISPLKAPMDPDYSELDFEYLPNGGWDSIGHTLFVTTWRTFSPEPNWKKDNVYKPTTGNQEGWNTLVMQVAGKKVRYFINGKLLAEHGGAYYPRSLMSINFNLWFIKDKMVPSHDMRQYREDIDWVFFEADMTLTPQQVDANVTTMRRKSIKFEDSVTAPVPVLTSPCDF